MTKDTIKTACAKGRAAGEQSQGSNPYDWTTERKQHDAWAQAYTHA